MRSGRFGTHDEHSSTEEQYRTATRRYSVYIQLRRLYRVAGGDSLKYMLVFAIVARNVRRGTAHVEANHGFFLLFIVRGLRVAYHSTGRATEYRSRPSKTKQNILFRLHVKCQV